MGTERRDRGRAKVLPVARYRFRATFRRRWGGYAAVVLLVGILGGVAMGALAGARRTQSAFPAHLARSGASDLEVGVLPAAQREPFAIDSSFYRQVTRQLAHLPGVLRVAASPLLGGQPMKRNGAPAFPAALNAKVAALGSVNGMYFAQDRLSVTRGRLANPHRVDEFVATAEAQRLLGWHVGTVVPFGFYTIDQSSDPNFGTPKVSPLYRISARLTGTVVFPEEIARDDVDRYPTKLLFTPALTSRIAPAAVFPTYALRLARGRAGVPAAERAVIRALPPRALYNFHLSSVVEGQVERAIEPETIALGAFGVIAAAAVVLIAGLAVIRNVQADTQDLEVLRALGASPRMTTADALVGNLAAVVIGAALAVVVALALSPLAPIGPARQVDPSPGIALDGAVLAIGFSVLGLALGAIAWASAARATRASATTGDDERHVRRSSRVAERASDAGLSVPAVTGLRFAFERRRGRDAAPVRSAMLGAVLAVTVVVATLTFASGLHTLVSSPRLYGWNWDDAIEVTGGGKVPPQIGGYLTHTSSVAAWTGYGFGSAQIDGHAVPVLSGVARAALSPPILSGHAVLTDRQIVLGPATLAQLHKHVGNLVLVGYGRPQSTGPYIPPTPLTVVGTATFPAVGSPGVIHPSMGTGALVPSGFAPQFQRLKASPDPNLNGPALVVVRMRPNVSASTAHAVLAGVVARTAKSVADDPNANTDLRILPVQRPAEIVNYRATGATPALLAAALAVGALVGLALTLITSVRRRRRELALLKTVGLTRRQLASTVAWQASAAAVVGVVVGLPVGIVLGRWSWTLFARQIDAVPHPTVPVGQLALVAVAVVVLANLAATIPGRLAARTRTSVLLRAE